MATRQTRIFVPNAAPYDTETWAETLLGRLVCPLVKSNSGLEWFWFSRYFPRRGEDDGDCDISQIPAEFERDGRLPSVRFRFRMADDALQAFEQEGSRRIDEEGCKISHWLDWGLVGDLGVERFVGEERSSKRQEERASLVVSYLHSVSKLVLHALVGPDEEGRFRLEKNEESPFGSSFYSMHHLFCNMTNVPLGALVFARGPEIFIGTLLRQPQGDGWTLVNIVPLRF